MKTVPSSESSANCPSSHGHDGGGRARSAGPPPSPSRQRQRVGEGHLSPPLLQSPALHLCTLRVHPPPALGPVAVLTEAWLPHSRHVKARLRPARLRATGCSAACPHWILDQPELCGVHCRMLCGHQRDSRRRGSIRHSLWAFLLGPGGRECTEGPR